MEGFCYKNRYLLTHKYFKYSSNIIAKTKLNLSKEKIKSQKNFLPHNALIFLKCTQFIVLKYLQ